MKVGFIGLGSMGRPFSSNIANGGFDLTVYDVKPDPVADLVKLGAKAASSPREVAENVDLVEVAVSGGQAVDAVMEGPDGVLAGAHSGLTAVVHTSIYPQQMQRIGEEAQKLGIQFLDAQMSGGWKSVIDKKLCLMVGGDHAVLEKCRPVFETTATNIYTVGGIGMGAAAKIAQNLITAQYLLAASEGFRLAEKAGVDLEVFQDIVRNSSAQSWVADDYLSQWGAQERPWMYYSVLWEALDLGHQYDITLPGGATALQALAHSIHPVGPAARTKS